MSAGRKLGIEEAGVEELGMEAVSKLLNWETLLLEWTKELRSSGEESELLSKC